MSVKPLLCPKSFPLLLGRQVAQQIGSLSLLDWRTQVRVEILRLNTEGSLKSFKSCIRCLCCSASKFKRSVTACNSRGLTQYAVCDACRGTMGPASHHHQHQQLPQKENRAPVAETIPPVLSGRRIHRKRTGTQLQKTVPPGLSGRNYHRMSRGIQLLSTGPSGCRGQSRIQLSSRGSLLLCCSMCTL